MSGGTQVVGHLFNDRTSLVLAVRDNIPYVAYLGASLGDVVIDDSILPRGVVGGGFDHEVVPALVPLPSHGWTGLPGLEVSRDGGVLPLDLRVANQEQPSDGNAVVFTMRDTNHGVSADIAVGLTPQNVVTLSARVVNQGATALVVNAMHLCVPVSGNARFFRVLVR